MTRTGLAWALMAGVGVQVGHGGVLDLGYRYVNLGEAATKLDQFRIGTKIKDIEAHEFRVGLRWHLDRPAVAAAVPVHAPIVTRY
jgi:opacity protein-like surface antigen